ncbi:MAG: ATP-binding cassette domain-containing protein [Lachnospiraceae bacterium]|nr:ATP-binding cassette domain-containing protein [Lachnospiraceae bacterium]
MGWFEKQLNQRKQNDESAFEDSFLSLTDIHIDVDELGKDSYKLNANEYEGKITLKDYIAYIKGELPKKELVFSSIFALIATGVGMLVPYFTGKLTGEVIQAKDTNLFVIMSVYVVAAALGSLLISAIRGFYNSRVNLTLDQNVQKKTMQRLLNLPASFFKKYNTGELAGRFVSAVDLANTVTSGVFMSLVGAVLSLAYLVQLVSFTPTLIVPTLLILICTTGFSIFISLFQRKVSKFQLQFSSKESGVTYEMINGVQKIKLSGAEKRVFIKWIDVYSKSAKLLYNPPLIIRLNAAIAAFITLVGNIALYLIAGQSSISVGDYMAFQAGYGVLSGAFISLSSIVSAFASVSPSLNMASPILEETPETADDSKITLENIDGNIKLDNITFSYGEDLPNILNGISLDIKSGEYVAIVGKTGCGKSTLVRLLLGFEKPKSGDIYYDGININDINLSSLRKNMGTVTQKGTLFHADIFSNIIISSPNLKEKEAWEAAEIANIAEDIRNMPMGMHTIISEGQGSISGGQKQRIMIARAIVHKPKILIFDEATSALDNVTQQSISESISNLNCTRIVIAHRLSTIQNADRIVMLEGGRIIEDGSFAELIKLGGKFSELVKRQRLDVES